MTNMIHNPTGLPTSYQSTWNSFLFVSLPIAPSVQQAGIVNIMALQFCNPSQTIRLVRGMSLTQSYAITRTHVLLISADSSKVHSMRQVGSQRPGRKRPLEGHFCAFSNDLSRPLWSLVFIFTVIEIDQPYPPLTKGYVELGEAAATNLWAWSRTLPMAAWRRSRPWPTNQSESAPRRGNASSSAWGSICEIPQLYFHS